MMKFIHIHTFFGNIRSRPQHIMCEASRARTIMVLLLADCSNNIYHILPDYEIFYGNEKETHSDEEKVKAIYKN